MFQKTRTKLTLLNASVFFLIMAITGTSMYLYLRVEIIGRIDEALQERMLALAAPVIGTPEISISAQGESITSGAVFTASNAFYRNVDSFVWSDDFSLISMPLADKYPQQLAKLLQSSLHQQGIFTLKYGGAVYRVLNVDMATTGVAMQAVSYGNVAEVQYYQLVSDISTEVSMLNTVLGLIAIGIVLGAGISVLAGLYLANRALVPIRISWEKQQQFVADASHELRTPLAVLQAHTELLLRHPDHTIEQDSREIATILKEIQRMKKLVNGLLMLSQSDADKVELQMKPVRMDLLVEQLAKQFSLLASQKKIALDWKVQAGATVHGDEERLQQLLVIVFDNAIKYTPDNGYIHIACQRSGGEVTVLVKDSGIGVAPEELPKLFERFYRGDKVRRRTDGGTGLGLSIAQWIVGRHQGRIHARSEIGQGMAITIALPACQA